MDMKVIGENIRKRRKLKGLTQAELAEIVDLSVMSVRRYESGDRIVPEVTLQRIAIALGVSLACLQGWDEAISNLEAVGMSVNDIADEMGIPADQILEIINYKGPNSAEMNDKIIRVAQLLLKEHLKNLDEAYTKGPAYRLIGEQNQQRIVNALSQLNDKGQKVAVERIEELTQIPQYTVRFETLSPEEKHLAETGQWQKLVELQFGHHAAPESSKASTSSNPTDPL